MSRLLRSLWFWAAIEFIVLAVLACVRAKLWTYGSDTGTFAQIVADAFGGMRNGVEAGSHFRYHWSPTLALLWPLVALTRSALGLQLLQAAATVVCAPLLAAVAIRLLFEAGVPFSALQLLPGDGAVGAQLVAHRDIAGVVFTGSTEVARSINRTLAAKDGPIVPLIAETGGINAMIADATALPEQVTDDVVTSAFRSAGQRCSALRLLFLQDDVADRMIEMIAGAAQ